MASTLKSSVSLDHAKFKNQDSSLKSFMKKIEEEFIPFSMTLEITLRCNLRCHHCYNFDRELPKLQHDLRPELNPQEIYKIIDEISDAGCLNLTLTGGEALIHPHFFDFVRYARNKHMALTLKSNGVLLDQDKVKNLINAEVMDMEISLYGASALTHDAFTRATGSFEKTLTGIKTAKWAGVKTAINYVLTRHNYQELEKMLEWSEAWGITLNIDPHLTRRYDGTLTSLDNRLNREQLVEVYAGPLSATLPAADLDPQRSVQCGCALAHGAISSRGDVYPCIGAPIPAGNIREQPFAEIWFHSPVLNRIRHLQLDDFKTCKPCPHRPYCRRNSGVAYLNSGDYTGPDPWTCMEAEIIHTQNEKKTSPHAVTS